MAKISVTRFAAAVMLLVLGAAATAGPISQTKGDFVDKFRQLEGEDWPTPTDYRNAAGAPGHRYWQQKVDYRITARLDEPTRTISGTETVTYHNNSPDSLRHRMAAHDVEPALVDIAPDASPSLDDADAVKALVAYVGQRFRIAGVTLTPAGQQLAGDSVTLRYIGRLKGKPSQLLISGALFGETWDDHSTLVNIRRVGRGAGITRSLNFSPGDAAKPVALPGN